MPYNEWLRESLEYFNEHYGAEWGERRYTQAPDPQDDPAYESGDLVEFATNGDAYLHGPGGVLHWPKCVSPYNE